MIDGLLVTASERSQAQSFFDDSAKSLRPVVNLAIIFEGFTLS